MKKVKTCIRYRDWGIGHLYINVDAVQAFFVDGEVLEGEEDLAVIYAGMVDSRPIASSMPRLEVSSRPHVTATALNPS